jgi:class 3 adenylate cyclase
MLVLFNDPIPCPDPCKRAARMAVATRARLAEVATRWRASEHSLGFGVGIAHGFATLGTIGFEGRSDYSAIGTVVNLAARLCSEAGDGQILVDSKVRAALGDIATLEPAGDPRAQRPASGRAGLLPPYYFIVTASQIVAATAWETMSRLDQGPVSLIGILEEF